MVDCFAKRLSLPLQDGCQADFAHAAHLENIVERQRSDHETELHQLRSAHAKELQQAQQEYADQACTAPHYV